MKNYKKQEANWALVLYFYRYCPFQSENTFYKNFRVIKYIAEEFLNFVCC